MKKNKTAKSTKPSKEESRFFWLRTYIRDTIQEEVSKAVDSAHRRAAHRITTESMKEMMDQATQQMATKVLISIENQVRKAIASERLEQSKQNAANILQFLEDFRSTALPRKLHKSPIAPIRSETA